jgi:RHS repeat-associated protein
LELDENANIISYEEYYPYGETSYRAGRNIAEVGLKRYRYTGKEKDEESGLYYYGARYYACWIERWTAADPVGLVDGLNLYMYCRGSPIKLVDPEGTLAIDENGTGLYDTVEVKGEMTVENGTGLYDTVEVKGDTTEIIYLPGSNDYKLNHESTPEELEAFANFHGYTIDDPNPKEQFWNGSNWQLSSEGRLVKLEDGEHSQCLLSIEEKYENQEGEVDSKFQKIKKGVEIAAFGTGVALSATEAAYWQSAKHIGKIGELSTANPNLTAEATCNAQKSIQSFSNAAETSAKFLKKANIALSAGIGLLDVAYNVWQDKYARAATSAAITAVSIVATLYLINPLTSVPTAIFISIAIGLGAMGLSSLIDSKFFNEK